MSRKLYLKLYLAFLGVLIAIVLVAGSIASLLAKSFPMVRAGPRVAHHLSRSLPTPDDLPRLQQDVTEASDELGLDVTVIDLDGKELAHAGQPIESPPKDQLPRLRAAPAWAVPGVVSAPLRRQSDQTRAHAADERKRAMDAERVQVPIAPLSPPPRSIDPQPGSRVGFPMPWDPDPSWNEPTLGIVLVRMPQASEVTPIWGVRTLALLGALLVAAALLYPLSRSITRPLERLTQAAEEFGKGKLDVRAGAGVSGDDEVGRLARSFDEMAGRIERARRTEKELLANVSHELRTPLARLMLTIELIEPPPGPAGDPMRKRLASLGEEIGELNKLVSDVLTQSRLELAELPVNRKDVEIRELLEQSRERALAMEETAIDIEAPKGLTVLADEALLKRVVDNLLDNARKYASNADGEAVSLEAHAEGKELVLSVSDRGPGFPPADLVHVFDPFYRGQNAGGRSGGYGLGLALAKRVAEAHGGSITARNRDTGGAQLELRIPGVQQAA